MIVAMAKYFRLISVLIAVLFCWNGACSAVQFKNETLKYVVTYKWGLIHKDAGDATLTLRRSGDLYKLKLTAKSRPWADKFYSVRDTLESSMRVSDLKPTYYIKRTHEKDKNDTDKIKYFHNGNSSRGEVTRIKIRKGEAKTTNTTLNANGPVFDFLSIFYYLRKLDYAKLDKYNVYTATVFSGSKKETVKIKSLGKEMLKMRDKSKVEAYHIRFNFTQEGGKKSSDDIDCWISTDENHIPLYLVGQLPIGEVRVYLTSQS